MTTARADKVADSEPQFTVQRAAARLLMHGRCQNYCYLHFFPAGRRARPPRALHNLARTGAQPAWPDASPAPRTAL